MQANRLKQCLNLGKFNYFYLETQAKGLSSVSSGKKDHYKLVVAGAGSGGSGVANTFGRTLGKGNVAVIEPSQIHYYQPMWTLIGAGIKTFDQCHQPTETVLSKSVDWLQHKAADFKPDENSLVLDNGRQITYDYLVVAVGMQSKYNLIKGAEEALAKDPMVVSNYDSKYVKKTFNAFQKIQKGEAIFTFPQGVIKCGGAPQKIMYLFDDFARQKGIRDNINISFYSALGVIFPVEKYAKELTKICDKRKLKRVFKHNLTEIKHDKKTAVFENLDTKELTEVNYDFLHVSPSFQPWDVIKKSSGLSQDGSGWVTVNKESLQHVKYNNVFSLGDCSNVPTGRSAAAVAGQLGILCGNLKNVMEGKPLDNKSQYDGYTSCPLVTSSKTCIMAEFDFNLQPKESFFFNQAKERRSMFFMKSHVMPQLYWSGLVKGFWKGPAPFRWLTNPTKN